MRIVLFGAIALVLMLASCKKQNNLVPFQETEITSVEKNAEPIPVYSPALFFFEPGEYVVSGANLYRVDFLTYSKPKVTKMEKLNAYKEIFLDKKATWAYNTQNNEILLSDPSFMLYQYSTISYKTTTQQFVAADEDIGASNPNHLRISPDNSTIYRIAGKASEKIISTNLVSKQSSSVFWEQGIRITAMDIDFANGKVYFVDANTKSVYRTNLDGSNKAKITFVMPGESVEPKDNPILRVDSKNNKIYLSTHSNGFQISQKFNLWSCNIDYQTITWKRIFYANDPSVGASSFAFDLYNDKQIFYTLYQEIPNYPVSTVGRLDLDGSNNKTLFVSKKPIRNVIVAMPKANN